jgi:TolA-binding protein
MSLGIRSLIFFAILLLPLACKTKAEIRREQELERLKQDVAATRADRADTEVATEELKEEVGRLTAGLDERMQVQQKQFDELRKDMATLTTRIQALEQRAATDEVNAKQAATAAAAAAEERAKPTLENGKRLFDEGKYEEAADILRAVITKSHNRDEVKKAHFFLAESLFAGKDYASAALEFSDFQKNYPKDSQIPTAIYRQANAFRNLGKNKEAKLFYQELIERYPKNALAAKAKTEKKKIK